MIPETRKNNFLRLYLTSVQSDELFSVTFDLSLSLTSFSVFIVVGAVSVLSCCIFNCVYCISCHTARISGTRLIILTGPLSYCLLFNYPCMLQNSLVLELAFLVQSPDHLLIESFLHIHLLRIRVVHLLI